MTDQQGLEEQESDLESGSDCYEPVQQVTIVRTNGDTGSLTRPSDRSVDFHSSLSYILLCWYISLCNKYPENPTGFKMKIKKIFGNALELGQFSEKLIAGNDESGMELLNYVDHFHCEHSHKANLKNVPDDKSGEKWANIPAFRAAQEVYIYKTPLLKPLHTHHMARIHVISANKELSRILQQSFLFERRVLPSEDQRNFVVFPAHFNCQNKESANIENRIISHDNLSNTNSSNNEEQEPGNNHRGRTDDTTVTERPQEVSINGNHTQTGSPHEESENGVINTESPHEESENGGINMTDTEVRRTDKDIQHQQTDTSNKTLPKNQSENDFLEQIGINIRKDTSQEDFNSTILTQIAMCATDKRLPKKIVKGTLQQTIETNNTVVAKEVSASKTQGQTGDVKKMHSPQEKTVNDHTNNTVTSISQEVSHTNNTVISQEVLAGETKGTTQDVTMTEVPQEKTVEDHTNNTVIAQEVSHTNNTVIAQEVSAGETKGTTQDVTMTVEDHTNNTFITQEVSHTNTVISQEVSASETKGTTQDVPMTEVPQEKTVEDHTNNTVIAQEVSHTNNTVIAQEVSHTNNTVIAQEVSHTNNTVIAQEVSAGETKGTTQDVTMTEVPQEKTVEDHSNNTVIVQKVSVSKTQGQTGDANTMHSPQEKTVKDHTNNTVIAQEVSHTNDTVIAQKVSAAETKGTTHDVTMTEVPQEKTVEDHTNNTVFAQEVSVSGTQEQTGDVNMMHSPQEKTVNDHQILDINNIVTAQVGSVGETQRITDDVTMTDVPQEKTVEDHTNNTVTSIAQKVSVNETQEQKGDVNMIHSPQEKTVNDHQILDINNIVTAQVGSVGETQRITDDVTMTDVPQEKTVEDNTNNTVTSIAQKVSVNETQEQKGDVNMIHSPQEKTVNDHQILDINNIVTAQVGSVGETQRITDDVTMTEVPQEKIVEDHTNNTVIAQEMTITNTVIALKSSVCESEAKKGDGMIIGSPQEKTAKDHTINTIIAQEVSHTNNTLVAQKGSLGETQGQTGDVTTRDSPQQKTVEDCTNNTVIAEEVSVSETQEQTGDVTTIPSPQQKTVNDHTNNTVTSIAQEVSHTNNTVISQEVSHTNNTVIAKEVSVSATQEQTGDITMIGSPQEKTANDHTNNTVIAQKGSVGETQGQINDITMIDDPQEKTENNIVNEQELSLCEMQKQAHVTLSDSKQKDTIISCTGTYRETFTELEFSQTDHLDLHEFCITPEDSMQYDNENLSAEDQENVYKSDASETYLKQVYTQNHNSLYILTDEGCYCPDLGENHGPYSTVNYPSCKPLSGWDDNGYHSEEELETEEQTYPKEFNFSQHQNLTGIFLNTTKTEDNVSNTFIPDNQNDVPNTNVAKPMQNNTAASQCTEQPTIQSNSDRQTDSDMLEGRAMVTASQQDSEKYIHQTNMCLQRRQNTVSPQHTQHNNHLEDNSRECISGQNVSTSASIDVNSSSCTTDVVRWDPRQMNHVTQYDMEDRHSMNQFSSENVESYSTPFPEDIPTFGRTNPERTPSSNADDTTFDFLQMRQTFLSTSVTPDTPGYESAHHTSSRTGSESPLGRYPVVQHGNAASWKQDGFTVRILHCGKVLTELKLYAPIGKDELSNMLSRDVRVQELLRQYPGHIGYSLRALGRRPDTMVDRDSVFELVIEF